MLLPQIVGGLLQQKPKVPDFVPIDAQAEQAKAIAANEANLPGAKKLANQVNEFNYDNLSAMYRRIIPNYDEIMGKASGNIADMLSGKLPQDVQDMVMQKAAQSGVAGGFSGSGFGRNMTAKDLGLTSLQLTQQGLDSASKWLSTVRSQTMPNFFDASSMFITPGQQIAVSTDNRNGQFQRNFIQNQLDAQYSPGTIVGQAIIKTDDQLMQIASSVAGSAAGAAI